MNHSLIWIALAGFYFLSGTSYALTPQLFIKKSPIQKNSLSLSLQSLLKVKANPNGTFELKISGNRNQAKEVFLDGKSISSGANKRINTVLRIKEQEEIHELRVVEADFSEQSYFFQVELLKKKASPLRVRVRSEKGEIIELVDFNSGEFSAADWVGFEWLKEDEVLNPEEIELKAAETKRKKIQAMLEKEKVEKPASPNVEPELRKPANALVYTKTEEKHFHLTQGIGFFSLEQPETASLDSVHWAVKAEYRKSTNEGWEAGIYGQGFLVPLSVSPGYSSPRFVRAGFDVGMNWTLTDQIKHGPRLGFDYQTLLTSSSYGYRGLMGPRFEWSGKFDFSKEESLGTEVFLNVFDSTFNGLTPANYQWGARFIYQWEYPLLSFQGVMLGAEFSRLEMMLIDKKLYSSVIHAFFGVRF